MSDLEKERRENLLIELEKALKDKRGVILAIEPEMSNSPIFTMVLNFSDSLLPNFILDLTKAKMLKEYLEIDLKRQFH